MRDPKKLLIKQLDRKLGLLKKIEDVQVPEQGWIYTIRTALNMTLEQLGKRLNNMSKQGVKDIEVREASGTITINSLKEAGNGLGLKFVYGFIPNPYSLEELIDLKATELAKSIVLRTQNNMLLENQGNTEEIINEAIKELASELKREMRKSLWD